MMQKGMLSISMMINKKKKLKQNRCQMMLSRRNLKMKKIHK